MYKTTIDKMKGGWIIGDFEPSLIRTKDFEIAIKKYKKDDFEKEHFHKVATEITIIVSGRVKMFGQIFETNDVIVVEPNDSTSFSVIEDTVTIVVKTPSIPEDKYIL